MNGTIHAKHLIVTGKADGVFRIEQCLEIHGTGCVEGDVEVGALVVDEGGILQGTCVRRGHKSAPAKGKEAPVDASVAVGSLNGVGLDEKPVNGQPGDSKRHGKQPASSLP